MHRDIRQFITFHLQEVVEQEEMTKQSTSKDFVHTLTTVRYRPYLSVLIIHSFYF